MANPGLRAMYTGVDSIMSAFDTLRGNNPFYSVWYGRDMMFQYAGEDMDAGRLQLSQMLEAAEDSGNTDILTIKFHPKAKGGYITNKTDVIGTMPVRVVPLGDGSISGIDPSSSGLLPSPVFHMFKRIDEHLSKPQSDTVNEALLARIGALELQVAEPVQPEKTIVDQIKSVLEIPGITDVIVKLLGAAIPTISGVTRSNLMISGAPGTPPTAQPNTPMNEPKKDGTAITVDATEPRDLTEAENDIIDKALSDLSFHCDIVDVLPKLAKFAAADKSTFDYLLSKLK